MIISNSLKSNRSTFLQVTLISILSFTQLTFGEDARERAYQATEAELNNDSGSHDTNPEPGTKKTREEDHDSFSKFPHGFDSVLTFKSHVNVLGNRVNQDKMCVSTMIAKIPLIAGQCKLAFMTTGDCTSNTSVNYYLHSLRVNMPRLNPIEILNKQNRFVMAFNKVSENERTLTTSSIDKDGTKYSYKHILPGGQDVALMNFEAPCNIFGSEKPAKLAECKNNKVNIKKGEDFYFQKRMSAYRDGRVSNSGGGYRVKWKLVRDLIGKENAELRPNEKRGPKVEFGDGGSPISNEKGELVGMTTSSTTDSNGYSNLFDPSAVCVAREQLNKWKMWPQTGPKYDYPIAK